MNEGATENTSRRRDPPQPGWLSRLLWPVTSYVVTNVTVTIFWFLFFVLNRTTVTGRHHVGSEPNTLLLANHQTMIDSFLIGIGAYYPKSWFQPRLIPWNPAAVENFFGSAVLAWLAYNWKCIPIREGRRDPRALRRMADVLPDGVMTLFPEGTRSRDGSVRHGRPGAGVVALATGARVIPVAIKGMRDVLPIGKWLPRIGRRVSVAYGAPIVYDDLAAGKHSREAAQELVDRAMAAIASQYAALG